MSVETKTNHQKTHGSVTSYVIGFCLSLALTFAAYFIVTNNLVADSLFIPALITLATIQLLVQLIFFLHLGQEKKPRWNLWFFLLTVSTILTVVIGALWIMNHLEYNHTEPEQIEEFILHDEGLELEKQEHSDH